MSNPLGTSSVFTKAPSENIFNIQISWKWLLGFLVVILIGIIVKLKQYTSNLNPNLESTNIIIFCLYLFVFNYMVFMYNISIYYYRLYRKGPKGAKGIIGERGQQGINTGCDICTKKTGIFKKDLSRFDEKQIVDDSLLKNAMKNMNSLKNKWVKVPNYKQLGSYSNISQCKNSYTTLTNGSTNKDKCQYNRKRVPSYLTGALANHDRIGGIYTMQFLYDGNKIPNKHVDKSKLLGTVESRFGSKLTSNLGKYSDFKCPPGSGIYKIDTLHTSPNYENGKLISGGIKGTKFFCKDIKTGKKVNVRNDKNKLLDGVSFGLEPEKHKGGENTYHSIECKNIKKNGNVLPSFISDVSSIHGAKVNTLNIHNCSYYDKSSI